MAEKKTKKINKMKVAVISLAVALVVAIGGMVGVYAASQQTVGATFTVSYSIGDNVAVAIGAKAMNTSDMSKEEWFTSTWSKTTDDGLFVLDTTLTDDAKLSLTGDDYSLGTTDAQIIFFYFRNLTDKYLEVRWEDNSKKTDGLDVTYYICSANTLDGAPNVLREAIDVLDLSPNTTLALGVSMTINSSDALNKNQSYSSDGTKEGGISFSIYQAAYQGA